MAAVTTFCEFRYTQAVSFVHIESLKQINVRRREIRFCWFVALDSIPNCGFG